MCEQLAQGCYLALHQAEVKPIPCGNQSGTLPLYHQATHWNVSLQIDIIRTALF